MEGAKLALVIQCVLMIACTLGSRPVVFDHLVSTNFFNATKIVAVALALMPPPLVNSAFDFLSQDNFMYFGQKFVDAH